MAMRPIKETSSPSDRPGTGAVKRRKAHSIADRIRVTYKHRAKPIFPIAKPNENTPKDIKIGKYTDAK